MSKGFGLTIRVYLNRTSLGCDTKLTFLMEIHAFVLKKKSFLCHEEKKPYYEEDSHMKKFFLLSTLLSCSFILSQSLLIYASMVISPNVPSTPKETNSKSKGNQISGSYAKSKIGGTQGESQSQETQDKSQTSENEREDKENQEDMAASMIETAQAAKDYVETIDKGQYAESWKKGDKLFQQTITQEEWVQALNGSRKGLGRVMSRELRLQRPAWNPKGLPKGAYMVIEYNTSFEYAPHAGELLTLRKGADGKWRVLTYQVI